MKEKIIDYIRRNRVSTTEVADCLGKTGVIPHVLPINRGQFKVGKIFWGYAYNGSNWDVHRQLEAVEEGDIVFIEAFQCEEKAVFGDLVSKYLMLYKQCEAIVVSGFMRDIPRLIKEDWPVWCKGFTPIGCSNLELEEDLDCSIIEERHKKYHGAIGVCDDSGVVIIPKELHTEEFYSRLEFIEKQEDIWYDCIDRLKMSTYETVCLKKYRE